jgi:1-acyl-sn-glycerol-3-phosphate acyltransferase
MRLFKRNSFGHILFLKRWVIRLVGILSYRRFRGINNLKISGSEIIQNLPENNVLFVSNHQTYFADATAMYHVINASLKGRENSIKNIGYIWWPKLNLYFVAAKETMKEGLLPKILAYAGSVSIERSWRSQGKDIKRNVQSKDIDSVEKALKEGWVITFPQGTTTPWKPIRKGTAHLIKKNKPIVVPVVIDGFRRSFDKKGLFLKKKGVDQLMRFKKPMKIDYENDSIDQIVKNIGMAIEQDHSFLIN